MMCVYAESICQCVDDVSAVVLYEHASQGKYIV